MSKLIYCATPSRIVHKKNEIMRFVQEQGHAPFHPFQAFPFNFFENHGSIGREKSMEFCFRAVAMCDEFWIFGISHGTLQELQVAQKYNKPVRLFFHDFDEDWEQIFTSIKHEYPHQTINSLFPNTKQSF